MLYPNSFKKTEENLTSREYSEKEDFSIFFSSIRVFSTFFLTKVLSTLISSILSGKS